MRNYFIESFEVTKLWGYQDIDLIFNRDVNILIGPNGSGKTTILNILYSILSGDLRSILDIKFNQAEIKLRGFKGRSERTVRVEVTDTYLKLKIGHKEYQIDIDTLSGRRFAHQVSLFYETDDLIRQILPKELYDELTVLVPVVWLPVSRRLPVTENEEDRHRRTNPLESVDSRLKELLRGLFRYHSRLSASLSERYKVFEHRVLSEILYSKEHDQIKSLPSSLPTAAEKRQLVGAFKAAQLLDEQMQLRIDEHFDAAQEALKRIRAGENTHLKLDDLLVVPLIGRTKAMVEYAAELEEDRNRIFAPLRLYEENVNSFFNDKSVKVDDSGNLKIEFSSASDLDPHFLSSGEKQILILLTEALLRIDKPVVYMADEPELSLHISWQEKLLESLTMLGEQMQVIVATHSPDIVGKFQDKIIDLGRKI